MAQKTTSEIAASRAVGNGVIASAVRKSYSVPAGQDGNERQREAQKHEPKDEAVPLDTIFKAQVGSEPRNGQHDQSTANHDPEREERNDDGRAVLGRKVGQADLLGGKAHARDQTAENGDLDFIIVGL